MPKYKFVGNDRIESKHWAVEFVCLDEGICGEYDETNPDDYYHLRFDYYSRPSPKHKWDEPNDSSYCCLLNADISNEDKRIALKFLLDQVADLDWDYNVKKLGERMSWLSQDDIELIKASKKSKKD